MTALDEEIVSEVITCSRFGELDELKSYIDQYSAAYLVEKDEYGNTALHMASANGHLGAFQNSQLVDLRKLRFAHTLVYYVIL